MTWAQCRACRAKTCQRCPGCKRRPIRVRLRASRVTTCRRCLAMNMPGHDMSQMPGMQMPAEQHAGHNMAGMAAEPPLGPPPARGAPRAGECSRYRVRSRGNATSRAFLLTKEHGGMEGCQAAGGSARDSRRQRRGRLLPECPGLVRRRHRQAYWLKSEVEGNYGRKADRAEFQALWSHAN